MGFDLTTATPIKEENADGLHEQGGQFDITTAQPISDVAPAISTPNPIPEKFSWQLAGKEAMAQIGDFFNAPSRFLGISKSQPQSKLATETLPAVGKFLTEPLGDFTIPTFSAENVKKLFKGDFNFDTIEISPTPLEVGINVAGAGIPAARQLSYNINRNMLLNNLINTEKVRGALIESMPAFDELIGSKLPKEAWADLSMEQKIAIIGQQAEKNPQVGQLVKGLSTGEIKPITAPETPATPQAGENVNFVNPEGIQKAGVIEGVEGNRVAINLDGKTIIAPINQISPYIAPQSPETPQNPLPQAQGEAISPEKPTMPQVEGEGTLKTRGLAQGVEAKAIENKLTDSFGALPEYRSIDIKQQASKAQELLLNEPDRAKKIAMGEELAPEGVLPESLFVAVENKAIKEGDVATLRELATSSGLTAEATTMGQRIRMLAERDPESPVTAINEVTKARSQMAQKRLKKADTKKLHKDTVNEIKASIKKTIPNKQSWTDFIKSIEC